MPTLLSLPAELHLSIIKETDLYDLEALWTSCKTFYAYGEDKLRVHAYRKAKFHTITVGWDAGPTSLIHPLFNLRDVLEDEEIRLYPRVMQIKSLEYSYLGPKESERQSEFDKIIEVHGDRIDTLVAEIHRKLLPNAPKADATTWSDNIQWAEPDPTILLLQTLFSHLEYLHIHDHFGASWAKDFGALSTSLTAAASDPNTNSLGVFSRLSSFTLTGDETRQSEAGLLSPFMSLPTMRSIEAYDVNGRNIQWSRGIGCSQVTDIKLELCDIDTATLTSHISAFRNLATLNYTFYPSTNFYERCSSRWEPRAIIASLSLYARDTLTILELTAANLTGILPFQDDEPYIGSLRAFRVLRSVKLDTMMLYKPIKKASRDHYWLRRKVPEPPEQPVRTQPLIDFLPASIQRFHMTSGAVGKGPSVRDVGGMFKGLSNMSTRYLPILEEICIEFKDEESDKEVNGRVELRSRCKKIGIKLESIKWSGETSHTFWMK